MNWAPGSHGNTFGGNPLACVAALATLDLLEGGLIENAARVGAYLHAGLHELADMHPGAVTDVRGKGLMQAIEFAEPTQAAGLVQRTFENGLLTLTAGPRAVRFCPPLVLTEEEVDVALEILGASL
jgi:4-aminobutyrate aminotransferase